MNCELYTLNHVLPYLVTYIKLRRRITVIYTRLFTTNADMKKKKERKKRTQTSTTVQTVYKLRLSTAVYSEQN